LNERDWGFNGGVVGLEVGEEFGDGMAGAGIAEGGSDFSEGNEDEGALGETGMRNFKAGRCEDEVAVEEDVKVEGAGAVGDGGGAVATEVALYGEKSVEEIEWRERSIECDDSVEEAGLIRNAHRLSGIERGTGSDAAERGDVRECGGESGVWRAGRTGKVGAEGDISEGH
jgi:hypothetical protein